MAFERFTKTNARGFVPKASIWSRGQIGFNQSAVRKFEFNKYDYVVLFYDVESKRIGIKLANKNEEGVIKISKKLASGGASVSAKEFLFHYDINIPDTRNYDLAIDSDTGFLIIDTTKYKDRKKRSKQ